MSNKGSALVMARLSLRAWPDQEEQCLNSLGLLHQNTRDSVAYQ